VNDIVIVIQPKDEINGECEFEAAVCQSTKGGDALTAGEMTPKAWCGIFQRRLIPAYEIKQMDQVALAKTGITHLALLTGDCDAADPFYFGQGEEVNGQSIMCWYNQNTDRYSFMHCQDCGEMLIGWLGLQQEVWSVVDNGKKKETRTLH
jgi:hypothetical protein